MSRVAGYKALADTGKYPGSATIKDIHKVANRLLAEAESFGMVSEFLNRKDDLLETADDLQELDHFFKNQRPTWEKLQKAHARFKLNEIWLKKDQVAAAALICMSEILAADSPYQFIKESEKLIRDTEKVNQALVDKAAAQSKSRVEARIDQVTTELDRVHSDADLRNQCLYPLQQLRGEVENQSSIAHLITIPDRARDLSDEAMEKIAQSRKTGPGPGVIDDPPTRKR